MLFHNALQRLWNYPTQSVKNIQQKNIALMNIDFCINRITRSLILLACKTKIPVRQ